MKKPNPDEREILAGRIKALEEFFQLNGIDPHESVALCMYFIALQTNHVAQYNFMEGLFRKIWGAVERGET